MTEPLHAHLVGPEAALGGLRLRGRVGHGQIQGQGARVLEMRGKTWGNLAISWEKHGKTHGKMMDFRAKHGRMMEQLWNSGRNCGKNDGTSIICGEKDRKFTERWRVDGRLTKITDNFQIVLVWHGIYGA